MDFQNFPKSFRVFEIFLIRAVTLHSAFCIRNFWGNRAARGKVVNFRKVVNFENFDFSQFFYFFYFFPLCLVSFIGTTISTVFPVTFAMTSDQLGPHHKPIKVVSVFVNQKHVGGWKNRAQIISAILF